MTHDQASHLRAIMYQAHRRGTASGPVPRILAVTGGRPEVGATTFSLQLATTLAQHGLRIVLLDADLSRAGVAARLQVSAAAGIADVLAARRNIHEVLQRGPGGIQLVAGSDSTQCSSLCTERGMKRLLSQVRGLGRHADAVVIDTGSTPSELTSRLWEASHDLLLVTTLEPVAVMDGYALLKTLRRYGKFPIVHLVATRAANENQAAELHARFHRSCERFLELPVEWAGWLPEVEMPSGRASAFAPAPLTSGMEQIAARFLPDSEENAPAAA